MPVWGVVNQKGGVGKTTTAINLAAGLAIRGERTLLVDCDPQGNASTGVGVEKTQTAKTLYDIFEAAVEGDRLEDVVRAATVKVSPGFDIIPATLDLAGAEPLLLSAVGKEMMLRDALHAVRDEYDWVVLDAPPSLGILTINVLAASDGVLVPMQCEFFALEGLSQLLKTMDLVRRRINPDLRVGKVLFTMHDARNKLSQQVTDEVMHYFGDQVSAVRIPRNVRLSEAPSFGQAAVVKYPTSKGAGAYMHFVDEVMAACAAH